MSEWNEKDHRLDVTFDMNAHFVCVEHPALVKNPEKAMQTLGGLSNLEKVRKTYIFVEKYVSFG